MSDMELRQLSPEMVDKVLSFLATNDQLRFRRAVYHDVGDEDKGAADREDESTEDREEESAADREEESAIHHDEGAADREEESAIDHEEGADVPNDVPVDDDDAKEKVHVNPEEIDDDADGHFLQTTVKKFLKTYGVCKKTYHIGQVPDLVPLHREEGSWNHIEFMPMGDFIKMKLPMHPRRFNFDFREDEDVFNEEDWMMTKFIEEHASYLTHLTISLLSLPLEDENDSKLFTTASKTIEFLSIGNLQFNFFEEGQKRELPPFENLKTLKIFHLVLQEATEFQNLEYFWNVVGCCTNLVTLTLPNNLADNHLSKDKNYLAMGYQHLPVLLNNGLLSKLKYYDMENCWWMDEDYAGRETLFHLCESIRDRGILLQNIHCTQFDAILDSQKLQTIGAVIHSMRDYNLSLGTMQLPKMEKIMIQTSSCWGGGRYPEQDFPAADWPALRSLQLTINSYWLEDHFDTEHLFHVLFNRRKRPSVEILDLSVNQDLHSIEIGFPDFVDIAKTCHNLTHLTLQNWVAPDDNYVQLWKRLRRLQSVTLVACQSIGLRAFTGDNPLKKPAFLRLKNLRKLRLIKVHLMMNITDEVFRRVFRHLPLTELILDSYDGDHLDTQTEVTSFTRAGIESLLTSDFANTIETFPFKCFQLRGETRAQMTSLGQRFRSSDMN